MPCKRHVTTNPEDLLRKEFNLVGGLSDQLYATISFDGGFEQYGAYEDFGSGFTVILHNAVDRRVAWNPRHMKKDFVCANKCLCCAIEGAIKQMRLFVEKTLEQERLALDNERSV